jgi:hypothetical protein
MKKIITLLILLLVNSVAFAKTYTFDDLPSPNVNGGSLISQYDDFYFDSYVGATRVGQLGYIDPTPFLTPGVDYTGFNQNVIFNPNGFQAPNQMIFSKIGVPFNFVSGFWSAGVTGDVTINFEGYKNSTRVYTSENYLLTRDVVTNIALNWQDIDSFYINSSSAIWVADNLVFTSTSPVPEPSSIYLFAIGLLLILGYSKKYNYL